MINLGLQGESIDCVDALHKHRYLLSSTYKNVLKFHLQNWNTNFLEGLLVQLTTQHGILAYDNCFKISKRHKPHKWGQEVYFSGSN